MDDDIHSHGELDTDKLGTILGLATSDRRNPLSYDAVEQINDIIAQADRKTQKAAKDLAKYLIDYYVRDLSLGAIEDYLEETDRDEFDALHDDFAGCYLEMNREDED